MSAVAPCPSCQETPDPNARFCKHCGAALAKRCASCDGELDHDARFCKHCGESVEDASPAPPSPAATKPPAAAPPDDDEEPRKVRRRKRRSDGAPPPSPTTTKPPGVSSSGQPLLLIGGLVLVAAIVVFVAWQDSQSRSGGETPPPAAGGGAGELSGRVVLDPRLRADAPASGTLYVTARVPGRDSGPPLAAVRLNASPDGVAFRIGPNDLMMEGLGGLNQPVVLSARWDQDGDASSVQPGDMLGELTEPVAPGSSDVVITLDTRAVQEDARAGGPVSPPPGDGPPAPLADAPPTPAAGDGAGKTLSGTIVVAEALAGQAPSGGVFFVSARTQPGGAGPPLAAVRVKASAEPTPFTIGPKDIMMGGVLDKPVYLTVRWDQDSDAFSKQPGDLAGGLNEPVAPGSADITLTLTERLP